jgi:4-amino-4-deoxy-L-arabinose transferase-like glycosyltransferase
VKKILNFFQNRWEVIFLIIVISVAAFLRFHGIFRLQFFTYDQARDAILIKRMVVDHQFRLLGTQTSMPGMFLPPFYYYTAAFFLWLFRLNPIGIDFYDALIGVLTVPLIYLVANKIFGKPAGLFSASLVAVSPLLVEITRRAWNPNSLPFYILASFYFLYLYYREGKIRDFLLAFGFYGYCLSLHFGAWTLLPLFVFSWFYFLFNKGRKKVLGLLGALGELLFFTAPLFLFEIRHKFFLINQAMGYFISGQRVGFSFFKFIESAFTSFIALFTVLLSGKIKVGHESPLEFPGNLREFFTLPRPISVVAQRPFSIAFSWWGIVILIAIIIASVCVFLGKNKEKVSGKEKLALVMIWIWLIWGIGVSRLYQGGFFFFYYLYLFPIPFLLFGFLGSRLWRIKTVRLVTLAILILIFSVHLYRTTIFVPTWRDFNGLQRISGVIAGNCLDSESFNIATIRRDKDFWERNSVDYRYFVETFWRKKPLDWFPENYQQAEILFVVDETGQAEVLKSHIMEIEVFKPKMVVGQWEIEKGIKIYKLSKLIN